MRSDHGRRVNRFGHDLSQERPLMKRRHLVVCFMLCFLSTIAHGAEPSVKIGVLTDMGGPYGDLGGPGSVIAAEMAVRDFGNSVLGRPIVVVSADHQSKPDVAVSIARRWFDVEGVNVIVDLSSSPVALAVQWLAAQKKRLTLISTAAAEALTNEQCSAYGAHWTWDSYSAGKAIAAAMAVPDSTWFFVAVDTAGGSALQGGLMRFLEKAGAKIVGGVRHPLNVADMSSFLLQAQASRAKYVALANGGGDLISAIKQAREFGLPQGGQTLVATVLFQTDIKALGLESAQGLVSATGFVSDANPDAAEWSKRFLELHKRMPNDVQAGVYSAVLHYLKAVQAAGTDDADAVMAKMRETPVNDMFAKNGILRKDGRMVHDVYVVQAKKPAESKSEWDLVKVIRTIPGAEAFRPLSESKCPLVKASQ